MGCVFKGCRLSSCILSENITQSLRWVKPLGSLGASGSISIRKLQHLQAQGTRLCAHSRPCSSCWGCLPGPYLQEGATPPCSKCLSRGMGPSRVPGVRQPHIPGQKESLPSLPPPPWRRRRATRGWMGFPACVLPTGTQQFCPQPHLWLGPAYIVLLPLHEFSFKGWGQP